MDEEDVDIGGRRRRRSFGNAIRQIFPVGQRRPARTIPVVGRRHRVRRIERLVRAAERNAVNAPIQGSAADIIKIAMINIHKRLRNEDWAGKMLLQVHDELVFDVPKTEVEAFSAMVKNEMENAFTLAVPLVVDVGTGSNWLEAH